MNHSWPSGLVTMDTLSRLMGGWGSYYYYSYSSPNDDRPEAVQTAPDRWEGLKVQVRLSNRPKALEIIR